MEKTDAEFYALVAAQALYRARLARKQAQIQWRKEKTPENRKAYISSAGKQSAAQRRFNSCVKNLIKESK